MTRLLVGTDTERSSEHLLDYLEGVVDADDTLYIVNSLPGGEDTDSDDVAAGEDALDVLEDGLDGKVAIERHQYIRGNEPIEDLLQVAEEYDVDEYVIGIRKRSPVGKMVFGSTAQNLLLETELPVRCVPLASD